MTQQESTSPAPFSREDWEAWRDSPIALWLFRATLDFSETLKAEWMALSWGQGKSDPLGLCEMRTRADAYEALNAMSYDRLCELHGVTAVESE